MMSGMLLVPMRQMGMVAGFFMVSRLVVFCSLMVVAGSVLVVLGSLSMMICEVFRHAVFSFCAMTMSAELYLPGFANILRAR